MAPTSRWLKASNLTFKPASDLTKKITFSSSYGKVSVGLLCLMMIAGCRNAHKEHSAQLYTASFGTEPVTTVLVERSNSSWVVRNGEERVVLRPTDQEEVYALPVFGGSWAGEWVGGMWRGHWTDSLRPNNYRVPITLSPIVNHRSTAGPKTSSRWQTSQGVLLLDSREDSVWATISTATGDYRYLAGTKKDKNLIFSTFDGAHLFRFHATMKGDSLVNGSFLSGTHYQTSFDGVLLEGEQNWQSGRQAYNGKDIYINGVSPEGDTIIWSEETLLSAGKSGLVVDIMGTWCPNCMDEARLLTEFASQHPNVQFVSLAFERTTDKKALARLKQFQRELGLSWDVLLGGRANKRVAAETIGIVDTVHSFPTTIFWSLGADPVIHTGFNGPATGEGYDAERQFFQSQLLKISGRSKNH